MTWKEKKRKSGARRVGIKKGRLCKREINCEIKKLLKEILEDEI